MRHLPFWYPPILAYHRISPTREVDASCLSTEIFEKQMAILGRQFKPISLSDLAEALEQGNPLPPRAVAVTFDDGTEDHFLHAFPVLWRHRIPATFFLITGSIGKTGSLNPDQIHRMVQAGISFGSHTHHHRYLPELSESQIREELLSSRAALQDLGVASGLFSYPAGGFSNPIISQVQQAGFRAACTTNRGMERFPVNRWALRRITMHESTHSAWGIWVRCCGYYSLNRRLRPPS